ncbi:MAG: PEP-CTERM sorting domain-containing protein [Kiritimatiellae bacterium]|nr:PEP-CTERM sorting domain-containing protein [Kiritimatiellia bacterium]
MRKLFICTLVASLAFASEASYLYWQVNLNDSGITNNNGTYSFNNNAIGGFRVAAVDGSYNWEDYSANAATSTGYDSGSGYVSFGTVYATPTNVNGNDYLISEIGSSFTNASYTYYVEILASDTSSVIGVGTTGLTYADAKTQGRLVTSLSDIGASPLEAWTGGAYAAPEPTSGLLLLVGGALLALRRRRA